MFFLAIGLGLLAAILLNLVLEKVLIVNDNPLWVIATFFVVSGGVYVLFDRFLPGG